MYIFTYIYTFLSNWVKKFEDAKDTKIPALVEALVEKSKIARLQVIEAMKEARAELEDLKKNNDMKKVEKATKFLEDYWSKVQGGAFDIMPLKMPARVKSTRQELQVLIGEISGAEKEEEDDGYCYDWSLLEARVAENLEAEILEEPYAALEEELGAGGSGLKALETTAEEQWQHPENFLETSMKMLMKAAQ